MKKLVKFMGIMAMMLAVSVTACNGGSDDDDDDTPSIDNPDSGSDNPGNDDTVYDDTWKIYSLDTSVEYKVVSHDENSVVVELLKDCENAIHVEYLKEIDLTKYEKISYTIKADSTGSMFVGYWADEEIGVNDTSSYSPEGKESSFTTNKTTDKKGVLYFIPEKAGKYEFSNITVTEAELPSTSAQGRLSLEAVEGGIKVTARLLDTDGTPDSNDSYDNFNIKEKKSGIMIDLQRPLVGENPKEVSGIFPFVKVNETYEFDFLLSVPSLSIPYHTEVAFCKATSTGLNPDDYFDFDKSPAETKVIITEEGCLSIDKDIVSFFKQQPDYAYLRGTLFAGKNDPWDADWIGNWICNKEGWEIGVDYDELISATGFDLGSEVSPETIDKIISKGSWFTQDVYLYFSVDDIPYRMELIKSDVVSIKTGN